MLLANSPSSCLHKKMMSFLHPASVPDLRLVPVLRRRRPAPATAAGGRGAAAETARTGGKRTEEERGRRRSRQRRRIQRRGQVGWQARRSRHGRHRPQWRGQARGQASRPSGRSRHSRRQRKGRAQGASPAWQDDLGCSSTEGAEQHRSGQKAGSCSRRGRGQGHDQPGGWDERSQRRCSPEAGGSAMAGPAWRSSCRVRQQVGACQAGSSQAGRSSIFHVGDCQPRWQARCGLRRSSEGAAGGSISATVAQCSRRASRSSGCQPRCSVG